MWCVLQTLRLIAEAVGWTAIAILLFGFFVKTFCYKEDL